MSNIFQITPKLMVVSKQSIKVLSGCKFDKRYSTEQAVKTWDNDRHKQLQKDSEKISKMYVKTKSKYPQKPPFLKNIFLGKFDTDLLAYPELEKEELQMLNKHLEPVQTYFKNLTPLKQPPDIKSDFMENLRRLKLFGLQGPQVLDALELNNTEDCRFTETLASNTSAMMGLLFNEKLVYQVISKFANEEMKKKYLPGLISGNIIGSLCVNEPGNDKNTIGFNATGKLTEDNKTWVLNGEKTYVVNGNLGNLFIVLANTDLRNKLGQIEKKLTLFVVEKQFGGVTTESCNPIGLDATDFANIKFNNTHVPAENILGQVHQAKTLLPKMLTDFRMACGPACAGILRLLINKTVNYCKNATFHKGNLAETDYVQSVVAKLTVQLYAIESMNYLTSSLMDLYENQDCQMETIAVKIFSSQQASLATLNVMEMLGPAAYMKDHWCNILHRDALSYIVLHEPSENLKLMLSLIGLHYTGKAIQEKVNKNRNPFFYPGNALIRVWTMRRQVNDNLKLTIHLHEYLHPSLKIASNWLEYSVLRFEYAIECLLNRAGSEVINNHMELLRLAECLIDIYAMTACLARASRAYCIGLQHADMEIALAHTFCFEVHEKIKDKLNILCAGPYCTNDENYKKIAASLFNVGEYFPVHPLTRNY